MAKLSNTLKGYIEDLSSERRETVITAVEALSVADLRSADQDRLIKIIQDFQTEENIAPLWAMVILKKRAPLASVPALLAVLDSDYDYYCEAANEVLISIALLFPDETLDLIENFIWDRINHDPWNARLFAYEPVAALKDNPRAKSFLIRMFEADDQWRASIANDLADFGDRRALVLIRRAIEFAERVHDELDVNELRYAYAKLVGAPIRHYDNLELWRKSWTERWAQALAELGNNEDEINNIQEARFAKSPLRDSSAGLQAVKDEQKIINKLPLADFSLRDYLAVRERGEREQEFDETLRLLGLDADWTVEMIQMLMNESASSDEVISRIIFPHQLPSPSATEAFVSRLIELWNETPRDDLRGLTPHEVTYIPERREENERMNKKQAEWRSKFDDQTKPPINSSDQKPKAKRNDPCPCGSGKKFKKCYLAEDPGCKLLQRAD